MNIAAFYSNGNLVLDYDHIQGISFNKMLLWVKSVFLLRICTTYVQLRDNCVHFQPIECLFPHITYA